MEESRSQRAFRSLSDLLLMTGIDMDAVEEPDGSFRMVYINIADLIFCIRPIRAEDDELRLEIRELESDASNTLCLSESQRVRLKESQEMLQPTEKTKFIMRMLDRELNQSFEEETSKNT